MKKMYKIMVMALSVSTFLLTQEKSITEKHKEFLAEQKAASPLARKLNAIIGPYICINPKTEAAKEKYQAMWHAAQDQLEIEPQYHLPIFEIGDSSIFNFINAKAIAITQDNALYIKEDAINSKNYGMQKRIFLHEAAHHKYLDPFYGKVIALSTLISMVFGAELIKKPRFLSKFKFEVLKCIGTFGIWFTLIDYSKYCFERRADLGAAYALNCYACCRNVQDHKSAQTSESQKQHSKSGYLSAEELEEIAQDHERNGNICEYHRSYYHNRSRLHNTNNIISNLRPIKS
jgi:hypothetical protein